MKSLINIVPRKNTAGEIYYQARFFDKSGLLKKSLSFPDIKSRTEAYLRAREKVEEILSPYMPINEIRRHGILSIDEVKKISNLPGNNPLESRDTLITLLGITCGLGVSEICRLEREKHIKPNDMIFIETNHISRYIPLIGNIKERMEKMKRHFPESRYVIPNLRDMGKPCNPISIYRGIKSVISRIEINSERCIVPSVLRDTFITLLAACSSNHKNRLNMKNIDYFCGFDKSDLLSLEIEKGNKYFIISPFIVLMIDIEELKWAPSTMNWHISLS